MTKREKKLRQLELDLIEERILEIIDTGKMRFGAVDLDLLAYGKRRRLYAAQRRKLAAQLWALLPRQRKLRQVAETCKPATLWATT